MKKICIFFMIFLMLLSCFSCAKKETEEAFIAADETETETETIDNKKPADKTSQSHGGETKTQDKQETTIDESEKVQTDDKSEKQPASQDKVLSVSITIPDTNIVGYYANGLPYDTVKRIRYNSNEYVYHTISANNKYRIFKDIDLNELDTTDTELTVSFTEVTERGPTDTNTTKTVEEKVMLCEQTETMKNLKFTEILPVKYSDGHIELFERTVYYPSADDTVYAQFTEQNNLYGHGGISADDVEQILLTYIVTDHGVTKQFSLDKQEDAKQLYQAITALPLKSRTEVIDEQTIQKYDFSVAMCIKYKNGSGCFFSYQSQGNYYKTTPEFEAYLLSLFDNQEENK